MLIETLDAFGQFDVGNSPTDFQSSITQPLVNAGDWQGARRLWSVFHPEAFATAPLLRDPDFTGEYPPPFGWEVRRDRNGYAELGDFGLEGEGYGRRRSLLTRQYTILEQGDYRLRIQSEVIGRGLQIEVACPNLGNIAEETLSERIHVVEFRVPQQCALVEIGLYGRPTDPPTPSPFRIRQVSLERSAG
ncbi:hypothetical protein [Aurantiacibacter hainanensis]|uniref:hypothetical protein n=1 Tax=Aurantiacibacter hainanensis TaxID=3076114 RepID=UPI0030C75FE0